LEKDHWLVAPRAVVFGCEGLRLSERERTFFRDADPFGFILFQRNCSDPGQVRALCQDLRACVGRADAPILIDQEGGRVQRLKPPHWRKRPPMRDLAAIYKREPSRGLRLAWGLARAMAAELHDLGITVDCAPVLDVPVAGAHDVIGDRAFSTRVSDIVALAGAQIDGFLAGGVLPVIKHIPGHGRARADSHFELPSVDADVGALEATDFAPFRQLSHAPFAMTAHVVYAAIDSAHPATLSPRVMAQIIRGSIGYDGCLMSDDLSMKALSGGFAARTQGALAAGCDLALHCNGDMAEMTEIAGAAPRLSGDALRRAAAALAQLKSPKAVDRAALEDELAQAFGAVA
jgi:beta-N-acetylhexosaminidase